MNRVKAMKLQHITIIKCHPRICQKELEDSGGCNTDMTQTTS